MHADHWNTRAVLSWMALFFTDGARQGLSRLYGSFHILVPGPFWVGWYGCGGWFLWAGWMMRLDHNGLHRGLRLPGALVVELVDQDTTWEFPI